MRTSALAALAALAVLPFSALALEGEAKACGGCFHGEPPPDQPVEQTSVVTDHRMVFSISTKQTILWDQVRYTGDPGEFAWVLPVRAGARVELSNDEWLAALDSTTRTSIQGPTPKTCPGTGGNFGYGDDSSSGGCGGSSVSSDFASPQSSTGKEAADADAGVENVEVLKQEVVGPYEVVTLRSSVDDAIDKWLRANGFVIPPEIAPLLASYTNEKFDFVALKLRPGQSVRAMQPVRIVTPGADASMPLRMVAAGVGARVGMTLWVLGEGRYHTQNFPDAVIDFAKLNWDPVAQRSNYSLLADTEFSKQEGRAWITEVSTPAGFTSYSGNQTQSGTLANAYYNACGYQKTKRVPCNGSDAGQVPVQSDAGDASTTDGSTTDAGTSAPDSGTCFRTVDACDDLSIALEGMHPTDVWVTRLRAFLPVAALTEDLHLEASQAQTTMPSQHTTETYSDPNYNPCPASNTASPTPSSSSSSDDGCACTTTSSRERFGNFFLVGGTAMIGAAAIRRRRRRD